MSRIRSRGTKPEGRLYQIVRHALGRRWRIDRNVADLPGQPDVVIPSLKIALFADGCFYHSCPKHGHTPHSRRAYWVPKLARNLGRHTQHGRALRKRGYSVWRFWEHDLKGPTAVSTERLITRRLAKLRILSR